MAVIYCLFSSLTFNLEILISTHLHTYIFSLFKPSFLSSDTHYLILTDWEAPAGRAAQNSPLTWEELGIPKPASLGSHHPLVVG